MDAGIEEIDGVTIVTIPCERLEVDNVESVKEALRPALERSRLVLLDLATLEFLDSSGLGAIVSCMRKVVQAGGDFRLCNLGEQPHELLRLVRMDRVIPSYPSRQAGIESFRQVPHRPQSKEIT